MQRYPRHSVLKLQIPSPRCLRLLTPASRSISWATDSWSRSCPQRITFPLESLELGNASWLLTAPMIVMIMVTFPYWWVRSDDQSRHLSKDGPLFIECIPILLFAHVIFPFNGFELSLSPDYIWKWADISICYISLRMGWRYPDPDLAFRHPTVMGIEDGDVPIITLNIIGNKKTLLYAVLPHTTRVATWTSPCMYTFIVIFPWN